MSLKISFAGPEQRAAALRLLFARFPLEEQQTRLNDALRAVEQGRLNLDGLLVADEGGNHVGVALTMHQPDHVSLVWPPVLTCQVSDVTAVQDALMAGICDEIDLAGAKLAQALLNPDDLEEMQMLQRHSFQHLTDMFFVARTLSEKDFEAVHSMDGMDHEIFSEVNADRFAATIEKTYEQSLDCPFLDGFRNGTDALVSHRLSGCFDPAGWRLYRFDDQDIGVLLMNEHPDQDAIELVYFGIVPEFRGKGLGRSILADGVQAAALTGRAAIFLAVDCGNTYANALYGELGFAELARRRVMIRRLSQPAHE